MAYVGGTNNSETLYGTDNDDGVYGFAGNDALYGLGGDDHIGGQDGDDALIGGFGADHLYGGAGADIAHYFDSDVGVAVRLDTGQGFGGTAQGDRLFDIENLAGSAWDDSLIGNEGSNELYGLGGNDLLKGGGGADMLYGASGNDTLKGGGGADGLYGGSGIDTASYFDSPDRVIVHLFAGHAESGDADGDTFSGIENVIGSAYDDAVWGDGGANMLRGMDGHDALSGMSGDDILEGGNGNDALYGWDGTDTLRGEAGDDILSGNAGNDITIGGVGNDTYYVDHVDDSVTEYGGQGLDEVRTSVSWTLTTGADVENLRTIDDLGTAAINLSGNSSGNVVRGNNGNNILNGGDNDDELTGLGGQDSFLFDTPLNAATNVDVITDFNVADDTILLDDDVFSSGLGLGNIAAGEFVIGAAALDGNDRIIYNDTTGALYYDSDSAGGTAAVQFAQLSTGLALTYLDFFVVM